MQLKLKVYWVI